MTRPDRLFAADDGNAAVEMALVLPLLLVLIFGCVELGNYFYNEHILVKAVRDGARYAARQDMSYFTNCSTPGGSVVADTQNIVKTGLLSGGTNRMPFTGATIAVTVACTKTAGVTQLGGIYNNIVDNSGAAVGAPVVTVSATVPYTSLLKSFGFTGIGYSLYAKQQAAVAGW
jgi:Flp pilus assembly protein TadG